MTFIDWFAGIGGFREGMEQAGHKCVGFCEFDKYAYMSYVSMHLITDEQREYLKTLSTRERQKEIQKEEYRNGEWYARDIRKVSADDIPKADCWCAGFPCQDISVAGKQLGFTGNRSSLFFRVMYLANHVSEEKKPDVILLENVKNLFSVNGGWDFARLLSEMDESGYDAEWELLNSKDFGVPQNRERCFIIGHLRGRGTAEVFPVEGTDAADCICGIGHHTIVSLNKDFKHEFERVLGDDGICGTILARDYKDAKRVGIPVGVIDDQGRLIKKVNLKDCAGTLRSESHGNEQKVVIPVLTPDRANKRQNGRRFKEDGEEAFTLTSQDRHGVAVEVKPEVIGGIGEKNFGKQYREGNRVYDGNKIATALKASNVGNTGGASNLYAVEVNKGEGEEHPGIFVQISENLTVYAVWYPKKQCYVAIRKLTPKECFRLQGWSDEMFERAATINSETQLYKQAGNGVTVSVIKAIARRLI